MSVNENIFRAGIIPYVYDTNGNIQFMFMKPSDPKFGGPDWQIAKGRVEGDDDNLSTAIREGFEELGLKESNIVNVVELGVFLGRTCVFICRVHDKNDFDQFHYETGAVIWLTVDEFKKVGRRLHLEIVEEADYYIRMSELVDMEQSIDPMP